MNTTAEHTGRIPPSAAAAPEDASSRSAVSWSAILAGAAAGAALGLILLILGTGLGMSVVSPWSGDGVSGEALGWSTIAWISFTSIAASGLGGYLAGRLRTRWVGVHGDETYFRDTAHGFLSWAVATLLTAAVLTSAVGAILGTGVKAAGSVAGAATTAAAGTVAAGAGAAASGVEDGDLQYWADSMLRRMPSPSPAPQPAAAPGAIAAPGMDSAPRAASAPMTTGRTDENAGSEIARILANGLRQDALDTTDSQYLAQRVAEHTGMSPAEAQARVGEVDNRMRTAIEEAETTAREAADAARKATAYASLWIFITLLMGAFAASLLATFGGRQRDL